MLKTREEIDQAYYQRVGDALKQYHAAMNEAAAERKAALSVLKDPILQLLWAAKRAVNDPFLYTPIRNELKAAVDAVEQQRTQQ